MDGWQFFYVNGTIWKGRGKKRGREMIEKRQKMGYTNQ